MANVDSYVDDSGSIRFSVDEQSNLLVSQTKQIEFNLGQITALPREPTVYINKLRFKLHTASVNGGSSDYFVGHIMAGIVPTAMIGTSSGIFKDYVDFQTVKGWPIPMSKQYVLNTSGHSGQPDTPWVGKLSQTYSPKSTLLMNAEQTVVLSFTNDFGDEQDYILTIDGTLRRTD